MVEISSGCRGALVNTWVALGAGAACRGKSGPDWRLGMRVFVPLEEQVIVPARYFVDKIAPDLPVADPIPGSGAGKS